MEWYAGPKLIVKLSFPKEFTDGLAQKSISLLQLCPAVEKVVVQSAANLEFKSADFARSWKPGEIIPDAARRGFDVDRLKRPPITYDEKFELPLHVANRIIVRWKDEYVWNGGGTNFEQQFASFNVQAECNAVEEQRYSDHDLTQILEFDAVKFSVLDQLLLYQANEMVDYVQPDYIYDGLTAPNDPIYALYQKPYLQKISPELAWNSTTGLDSVIVAVVDSGANVASTNGHVAHPDSTTNRWSSQTNSDPKNFTTDPDSTDVYDYGADALLPPFTGSSHGSNVASIIGAQGNNGPAPNGYMCGVSWNVSLMHLKVLPDDDTGARTTWIVQAIDYARTNGSSAINLSLGGRLCFSGHYECEPTCEFICDVYGLDTDIFDAIERARTSNVVAVCAAGNDGLNSDASNPFTPAGMPQDNVIAVAASDQNDVRWNFTAYGAKTVDLAAPGVSIYGLKNNTNGNGGDINNFSLFSGTSQAAPHVTGTIALLKAKYGWENYHGLRDRVLMGTDALTDSSWVGYALRTNGRLNANKALHARTVLRNLSTRARVENGDKIMIGGFIIGGSATPGLTLKVAIRGLGPSLDPFLGVPVLPNPKLTLNNSSGQVIASNGDWGNMYPPSKADFIAAGLDEFQGNPISSVESGIVATLAPGAYTVFMESNNGTSFGVGLFEIYELEGGLDQQARLINASTRCLVRTGEEVAIAGVIVGDPTPSGTPTPTPSPAPPKRSLLMFGKGPSLGISGSLANPFLTLKNSAGTTISTNDSWSNVAAPTDELIQAGLDPSPALCGTLPCESALWPILNSGTYTTTLTGVSGGTGIGLVEIYEY